MKNAMLMVSALLFALAGCKGSVVDNGSVLAQTSQNGTVAQSSTCPVTFGRVSNGVQFTDCNGNTATVFDGAAGANGSNGAVGQNGAQGSAGPQGAQGITGQQGPAGAQGAQGPQGPQGVAGTNGTNGVRLRLLSPLNVVISENVVSLMVPQASGYSFVTLYDPNNSAYATYTGTGALAHLFQLEFEATDCAGTPYVSSAGGSPFGNGMVVKNSTNLYLTDYDFVQSLPTALSYRNTTGACINSNIGARSNVIRVVPYSGTLPASIGTYWKTQQL